MLNQKTVNSEVIIDGIGMHSGKKVSMRVLPALPNSGIQFKRIDISNNNIVIPSVFNVTNATLCTTISNEYGIKVSTIEHLMAALFGLGIDNAMIEIDNDEVPILDGSAKVFIEKIKNAGLKESNIPIKIISINKKITYEENNKYISIEPSKTNLLIDFEIKYKNSLIGTQRNLVDVYNSNLSEIYDSRTFCLYEDVKKLQSMGFALGGSLDNAIVVKDNEVLNNGGLRNEKEFVNHKILDCIGDLFLSGYKVVGKIVCSQGGHKLTNDLLRKVYEDKSNFSLHEIKEKTLSNTLIDKVSLRSIA
ncbi:UDP-3-O-acyl-N-acetylglucosamine deacetylase [Candidatus Pelagibacter bacterium]|jgi:UDP-3-O-[3-hydroxymyristoyl] N-acetylglucosamine deacetylase|nr:UDP-3-O-acyl-N-acetylglucosamine deacetylase [Candidatus Pelagibacter bacterium]